MDKKLIICKKNKYGDDAEYEWFKTIDINVIGLNKLGNKSKSDSDLLNKNKKIKITWKKIKKANQKIKRFKDVKKVADYTEFLNIIQDYMDVENTEDFIYIKFI
jgi:hypothetical protein